MVDRYFSSKTPAALRHIDQDCSRNTCLTEVDWNLPGVYAWIFDNRYIYIGKSKRLATRIRQHISYLNGSDRCKDTVGSYYRNVARKHADTAQLVVLCNHVMDVETLSELEVFWINQIMFYQDELICLNMVHNHKHTEEQSKKTSGRVKRWFANPKNRHKKSIYTKNQWKDPGFRQLNLDRLKNLHASGRKFIRAQYLRIKSPSNEIYTVSRRSAIRILRCGNNRGALENLFRSSFILSGWSIVETLVAGGAQRERLDALSNEPQFSEALREVSKLRDHYGPKLHACKPEFLVFRGIVYKSLFHSLLLKKRKELNSLRDWHERRKDGPLKLHSIPSYDKYLKLKAVEVL